MPRYIDADELLDEVQNGGWDADIKEMQMILKYVPEIDATPVVRGEWTHAINEYFRTCSVCGISMGLLDGEDLSRFKYCPFCGAKMEDKPCE